MPVDVAVVGGEVLLLMLFPKSWLEREHQQSDRSSSNTYILEYKLLAVGIFITQRSFQSIVASRIYVRQLRVQPEVRTGSCKIDTWYDTTMFCCVNVLQHRAR